MNYIKTCVNKITDNNLRAKTADLIEDTRPTFMQLYPSASDVTNIYNKLADAGLVDTSAIRPEQLFPPYSGKNRRTSSLDRAAATVAIILIPADFARIRQLT